MLIVTNRQKMYNSLMAAMYDDYSTKLNAALTAYLLLRHRSFYLLASCMNSLTDMCRHCCSIDVVKASTRTSLTDFLSVVW